MKLLNLTFNSIVLLLMCTVIASCNGQNPQSDESKAAQTTTISIGDTVLDIGKNIDCIFQDQHGNYWFASNGEGVYRYDGKTLTQFSDKDGLCSNFVYKVEEDVSPSKNSVLPSKVQ